MKLSVNQRLFTQITIWGAIFSLMPLIILGRNIPVEALPHIVGIVVGVTVVLTLNLKFLFPKFYKKGHFGRYILLSLLMVLLLRFGLNLVLQLDPTVMLSRTHPSQIEDMTNPKIVFFNVIGGSIPLFIILFISTLYEISVIVNQAAQEAVQLKSEKLEAELKFLKSQINPHFLFNSLNNIYTLTVIDPPSAGKNLLKLSEMLRYLLYECNAEKVPLGRELAYLENYIALFALKDEEALNIVFDAKDVDKAVMIAPLLFIPFVENAFKHSQIEDLENGWIKISLFSDKEQVYFEITNSLPTIDFSKDKVGGIGLQNVKRQLELLYPNKHQLEINQTEKEFKAYLTVYL